MAIAQSVPSQPGDKFKFQRTYPEGDFFSNITGYYTFAFGATQLERTQNDVLMGDTAEQQVRALPNILGASDNTGTVRAGDARRRAARRQVRPRRPRGLGRRDGPEDGRGAGDGQQPELRRQPGRRATARPRPTPTSTEINAAPGKPLLNNAYQERFMPGSAFKVLTTSIGFENGVISMDSTFPDETEFLPPQTDNPIQNFEGELCGGTMAQVFARSCNIPFAQTALALGPQRMVDGVNKWGVGEKLPVDLPAPASELLRRRRRLHRQPAAAGHRRLRPGQRPDGAAAHGDGRQHGGQRRADDEAVRRRRDARPRAAGSSTRRTPSVWKNPILPSTAADADRR